MRHGVVRSMLAVAAAAPLFACAASDGTGEPAAKAAQPAADPMLAGMTEAQQARYRQCLDDHRVVAMSWEAIQQNCRDAVLHGDPLGAKRPAVEQSAQ
jgi:hypothetical protein